MNLIAGEVAGGRFRHGAMVLDAPVPDGPALLAVRPEALAVGFGSGEGRLYRVTDFGSHAVVEIDLPEGTRVKAHLPEAPVASAGTPVTVTLRRHTLYRDDRVLWVSDAPIPDAAPVALHA
jgi:putative spermidine/putrescine transport system ATP-binding protein